MTYIENMYIINYIYLIYYNNAISEPILYRIFLSLFFAFNDGILKMPGNILIAKGYKFDNTKLINVSLIKIICVFLYTAQKHEI